MDYQNFYVLNYPALSGHAVLVQECFNGEGVMCNADIISGPRPTWEVEGDAEMKNRAAIGRGDHVSCLETRRRLREHAERKRTSVSVSPVALRRSA